MENRQIEQEINDTFNRSQYDPNITHEMALKIVETGIRAKHKIENTRVNVTGPLNNKVFMRRLYAIAYDHLEREFKKR